MAPLRGACRAYRGCKCADMVSASQALSSSGEQSYMKGMKTLEINPRHPLIVELKRQVHSCHWMHTGLHAIS